MPARYNIAWDCCGRHARSRERFALYFEDESGATAAFSYWDLHTRANRLSNALEGLGVTAGDRVAMLLPQRPETAIAYMAIFQMGAIAVPLSHLFGPDALAYRLRDAGAKAAIVDPDTLPKLWSARAELGELQHVIGVAGARETGVHAWEDLLERASARYEPADTGADDPALIIYTSGTTGAPKGALIPHRALLGNLPGLRLLARLLPAARRHVLVAGGLGLDRRACSTRCCRRCTSACPSSPTAAASTRSAPFACWRSTPCATRSCSPRRSR